MMGLRKEQFKTCPLGNILSANGGYLRAEVWVGKCG